MTSKIPVIFASANQQGNSALLVEWFLAAADEQKFEKIYLYDQRIEPWSNLNRRAESTAPGPDQDARPLIDKITKAETIIITTPIWNFSLPGLLKNFLDRALATGRVWSATKQKKVAGWRGKKFYLLFTMGAPWFLAWPNYLGVLQLIFTLWYYGASCRIVKCAYNCGNGQEVKISSRQQLMKKLKRHGRRLFG